MSRYSFDPERPCAFVDGVRRRRLTAPEVLELLNELDRMRLAAAASEREDHRLYLEHLKESGLMGRRK